jgi:hypothetical protein
MTTDVVTSGQYCRRSGRMVASIVTSWGNEKGDRSGSQVLVRNKHYSSSLRLLGACCNMYAYNAMSSLSASRKPRRLRTRIGIVMGCAAHDNRRRQLCYQRLKMTLWVGGFRCASGDRRGLSSGVKSAGYASPILETMMPFDPSRFMAWSILLLSIYPLPAIGETLQP